MTETKARSLDPKLAQLLGRLRSKIRRYVTIDAALAVVAIILLAFWIGLIVDWGPVRLGGTEMPRSARAVWLGLTVAVSAVVIFRLFIARIGRRLPDESMALLLERHHPHLAGRLITAVQLNRPRQTGDLYSSHLLQRVYTQAIEASENVDSSRVFRWKPIGTKLAVVIPLVLMTVALAIASPATLRQATSRLLLASDQAWPRLADLRMVGVEVPLVSALDTSTTDAVRLLAFEDRTVRVARGGAATLRIEARAEPAVIPEVCTVYYKTAGGLRGQVNMRRVGRVRDGYQSFALDGPPLAGITEDIELSIRGLDDRLDDFKILAVEPPNITDLQVEATYPPYLRAAADLSGADLVTKYQPGLRMREGTSVRIVGQSSTPVAGVQAAVTQGDQPTELIGVEIDSDGLTFAVNIPDIRSPTAIVMVPVDAAGITAPSPYRYFLGVVSDAAPNVQLRMLGIGNLVTPQVRIPYTGVATDDYGVSNLVVNLAPVAESTTPVVTSPETTDRDGQFEGTIDLKQLADDGKLAAFSPGTAVNLYGEATDAYDLGAAHVARTDLIRLDVVTADDLLAALERRELALRTRLEQTITEMRTLRDSLDLLRREGWQTPVAANNSSTAMVIRPQETEEPEVDRSVQLLQLRIQQAGLQANKTSDELEGIAASIDDILLEMINNRVDSPDRRQRIADGVRDPLMAIVNGSLQRLDSQITALLPIAASPTSGPEAAAVTVQTAEQVLLELEAVLEKMLDLESYNEVLDLVRGLIDNQDELIELTEEQRKKALQDLFKGFE
jgi:hypothetical protein